MARISGNDVSATGQGQIDFDTLYGPQSKNTQFMLAKATEGTGFQDPQFKRNQSEARRVGLAFGAYSFARPDLGNTPEAEAQYFLNFVGQLKDGEVLALDYELPSSNQQIQAHVDWCKKWLDYVFSKTGVRALIYMSESTVTKLDWTAVASAGYGLWVAKYLYAPTPDASFNTGKWGFAAMYQWTSGQTVPGIHSRVDGDVFFGDVDTFKKYGYKTPAPTPPPPPATDYKKLYDAEVIKNNDLAKSNLDLTTHNNQLQDKINKAKQDLA